MGNSYNKVAEIETAQYAGTTEKWTAAAPQHLSGVALEESDEGNPPGGRTSGAPGFSLCLEEVTRWMIRYKFMNYGQWFGWMVRNGEGI